MASRYVYGGSLYVVLLISTAAGSALMPQSNAEQAIFPPSTTFDEFAKNQSTASFSEKFANFTGSGLEKIRSGFATVINNVSSVFNRTQEIENVVLGAACTENSTCSPVHNATCDKGMCNCGPNFTVAVHAPDRCLRIVALGETCEEDIQCSKTTIGAICAGLHCVCSDLYTEEQGRCVPKRKLGSPCEVKDDCAEMPFAECNTEKMCYCPKPLIPSIHNNACLIAASPAGDPPCQEDIQCVTTYGNRSACINNICICENNYHSYNGKCVPDLRLGERCNLPYDCIVSKFTETPDLRECLNSTCVCKPGYKKINDNQCLKGYGYQLQASLAWLLLIFLLPYLL